KAIRATVMLDGGHVDEQLRVRGSRRVGVHHAGYSTHDKSTFQVNEVSDDVQHTALAVYEAGQQGHANEDGAPRLGEVPVVGRLVETGGELLPASQRVQDNGVFLEGQAGSQLVAQPVGLESVSHP